MKISIAEDGTSKGWSVVVEARLLRNDTATNIFRHFKFSDHNLRSPEVDIHGGSCIHMEYKDDGVSVQCGKSVNKDYPSGWLCKDHQMEVNNRITNVGK